MHGCSCATSAERCVAAALGFLLFASTLVVAWRAAATEQGRHASLVFGDVPVWRFGICIAVAGFLGGFLGLNVGRPLPGLTAGLIVGFLAALGLGLAARLVLAAAFFVCAAQLAWDFRAAATRAREIKLQLPEAILATGVAVLSLGTVLLVADELTGHALLLCFLVLELAVGTGLFNSAWRQERLHLHKNLSLAGAIVCSASYLRLKTMMSGLKYGMPPEPEDVIQNRYLMMVGRVLVVSVFLHIAADELSGFTEACETRKTLGVPAFASQALVVADIVAMILGSIALLSHDAWNATGEDSIHMRTWTFWGSLVLLVFWIMTTIFHHRLANVKVDLKVEHKSSLSNRLLSVFSTTSDEPLRPSLISDTGSPAFGFGAVTMHLWKNISICGCLLCFLVLEM